jgi:MFS family permease
LLRVSFGVSQSSVAASLPTRARYQALGFTLVLAAIVYLDRVCISTAAPRIEADLGLTDRQMGYVFSAYTFAYALMEVPAGWLADRFGSRLMLTRIVIWWSAMTALTGFASGVVSLFLIRLLFGVGEAGAFPGIARVFARWLPARSHGRAFGAVVMTGALGGALTQPLVVTMLRHTSWRVTFGVFGAVGAVWAAAWLSWFRDDPHQHRSVNAAELALIATEPPAPHPPVPWAAVRRSRSLLALCVMYFGAIYGWYFYLTWLPTYLLRARGFDMKAVGWLSALPLVGIAAGVLCGGLASDWLSRRWGARAGRRLPGLVGFPLAAAAIVGALSTPDPMSAALLMSVSGACSALGVSPAWAACLDIGGRHAGVITGAMNTFGNLGGALSPLVVGLSLDRWHSYRAPLVSVAVFYFLAGLAWLAIDASGRLELSSPA